MARQFIHHDKKQHTFCVCQDSLEERIGEEADVRIFDKCLDAVDISPIVDKYSKEGGKAFWPGILLKILIYGYSKGIQSSRKLAFAVKDSLSMKYLVGDIEISHETIAFFRVRFRVELEQIFKDVVQLIYEVTGTSVRLPFMDSVKLKASASDRRTKKKKDWKITQQELAELVEHHIEEYFSESINVDKEEDQTFGKKNNGYDILSEKQELIFQKAKTVLEERKKNNKEEKFKKEKKEMEETLAQQSDSDSPDVTSNTSVDSVNDSSILAADTLVEKEMTETNSPEATVPKTRNEEKFSKKEILEIEKKIEPNESITTEDIPETFEEKFAQIITFLKIEDMLEINENASNDTFLNLTDSEVASIINAERYLKKQLLTRCPLC